MINIVYVSLYFPPLGNAGTIRNYHITKYLCRYGLNPIIITSKASLVNSPRDYSFKTDSIEKQVVFRFNPFDLSWMYKVLWGLRLTRIVTFIQNHFVYPDQFIFWKFILQTQILKLVKKYNAKGIYISVSPFSTLSVLSHIKKITNIPIFIDFRDEWTNNPYRYFTHIPVKRKNNESRQELRALSLCSGIIYNNETMKNNFIERYPFLKEKPGIVVYNGFDDNDFKINSVKTNSQATPSKLTIVYTGSFYDHQNPITIWKALDSLIESNDIDCDKIQIDIYGKNSEMFIFNQIPNTSHLRKVIKIYPYQPHFKAIQIMQSADVLLLFIAPGGNSESVLTTKIFEYLRAERPILAIVPTEGEASKIIKKSKAGWIADSCSGDQITKTLFEIYNLWQCDKLSLNADLDFINSFSRIHQVKELAGFLKKNLI